MKVKNIAFDLFRYQILPKDRIFQPDLFGEIKTLDDLLQRKNELFFYALKRVKVFNTNKTVIRHKIIYQNENCILYRFAANRALIRETRDFTEEEIENWPSFYVLVWNEPDKQLIAIQERLNAFQHTEIVAKAIIKSIEDDLGKINLRAHVEALFFEHDFWDLIQQYLGKIKNIQFEIITPNMSNISGELSEELLDFAKRTNTARTNLEIVADPDSSIILNPEDEKVKGLVTYSSKGGGNISIKLRGISKRVHTKKSKKHIDITEMELSSKDAKEIVAIIKELLP